MSIWDSRFFRQPTAYMGVTSTSLQEYIDNNDVTTREVLTIAVQLTSGIRYVHKCELVLGQLDMINCVAVTLSDRQVGYILIQRPAYFVAKLFFVYKAFCSTDLWFKYCIASVCTYNK